jgi:hypothetical protein
MADKKPDTKPKAKKKSPAESFVHDQKMGARRTVIEEMFNDLYDDRRNIYLMNFFRGIFFGFGSVLGGTIVVALVVALLSLFVELPYIGPSVEKAQDSLQRD